MSETTAIRDAGSSAMLPASDIHGSNNPARRLGELTHQAARNAVYLLLGWLPPLVTFVIVLALGSAGLGTVVVWIGLPLLALTTLAARKGATVERLMAGWATDLECAAPRYRQVHPETPFLRRMTSPFTDPQVWLDIAWAMFGWMVSLVTLVLSLFWIVGALSVVTTPHEVHAWVDGRHGFHTVTSAMLHLFETVSPASVETHRTAATVAGWVVGLLFLMTLPGVLAMLARGRALLVRSVLSNGTLHNENATLRLSRDAGRAAETTRLRQLERDIHDGPQQRLVRLTMDIARTKQVMGRDPEQAQEMLDAAMLSTQEALSELRNLSRGIAPPVLVDRGLEPALTELAALSSVPVTLNVELPPELPDHVATAAYFAASEALTNVNKHSLASHVQMICGMQDHWLSLTVIDDGIGGARLDKGHGLAGLAERLRAVDGQLDLVSPDNGGTRLEAVILCR